MRLKLLSFLLLFVGAWGFGQSIFTNPITGINPNTANPYTVGQVVNPNITVSGIGRGAGISGVNANDRYNANSWETTTIDLNAYFEFTMTPNVGFEIDFVNFVYTAQASGTGPTSYAFRSSVDGSSTNIGTPTTAGVTIDLSNAAYQNITGPITFRLYGWGASGAGGTFSVNDFTFNGIVNSTLSPNINISPASITGLDYIAGNGPSAEQTFNVSGSNLANDITLTAPANFQISTTSGGGFGPNITLPQTGGDVVNTTIYTRLVGGLANGNYTGNINATSTGATAQNVAVSGTVIANVVITEIMYDTPGPDDLEWIEICNLTGNIQNIANYRIGVNGTTRFTFPAGANVPANSCITVRIGHVAASLPPECPFTPTYSNPIGTTDILANTGRTVTLIAANGTSLADTVTYNPSDGGNGNGSTLHVIDATLDNSNTNNGNWTQVTNGGSPGVNTIVAPCAVQNIVVRGNIGLNPTIAGNGTNTPIGTDNTLFAQQTIGNSQDKTFRVANEGTLPLTINSINIGGTNPGDFIITQTPSFNLAPGTFDILEISFAPTAAGQRNATVTILSNDPDTPSYIFNIRGTGNCAISSPTLSPTNGPVGTIVTLNGENFDESITTLSYRGVNIPFTVLSSSQIQFQIPAGASTGVVKFTNEIGCSGLSSFTVLDSTISDCQGTSLPSPNNLFISEITDHGTGSHSYIEIFNGTGANVDMSNYQIRKHNNGAITPTDVIALSGTLANNDVFIIAFGGSDAGTQYASAVANVVSGVSGINDNDNIRLYTTGGTFVDIWGETDGNPFTVAPKDYVYRRKNSGITAPSTTFNANDWTTATPVDYSDIGSYDFSLGAPPTVSAPVLSSTNCLQATIAVTATEGFADGNPLAYQWFALALGDTTWFPLSNDAVYSGVATNELIINNTFNLNNYQYYCEVRENTATCSQASDAVRIEIEQSIWNGTTWSNGAPNANTVAVLNANYTTAAPTPSFTACNLIVNAELNISDNYFIEVINDAVVNPSGNIIVQTRGAFVQRNDNGSFNLNGGNASVIKITAVKQSWYDYTYWSSPVIGETAESAFNISPANRRFYFDAANYIDTVGNDIDDDGNVWQLASGVLTPGVGYAATSSTFGMPFPRTDLITFNGAFNTGNITATLTRNPANSIGRNWNFIGNPYPSAINFVEFYNQNSGAIQGSAYLWSQAQPPLAGNPGNEGLNFNQSDYAIINAGSGNVAGGAPGPPPSNFIASAQGFFVNATGNGTVTFSNSIRMADTNSNNTFYRSHNDVVENKLWLNLTSDNGVFNQVLVAYVEGATNEDDGMFFDAPRNLSTGTYASLYSTINNSEKRFAIQGKDPSSLKADEIISLGFANSITVPTVFKISVAQLQGDFMSNNTVYIKDNLLNLTHDLTRSEYHFTAEVGEFNQRFEIVFNRESLSIGDQVLNSSDLAIIELPNGEVQFIVSQQHQIKEVTIVDLMGRVVYQLKGNHHIETYDLSQLSKAAYIAKVTLASGQTLHKKAVKRF